MNKKITWSSKTKKARITLKNRSDHFKSLKPCACCEARFAYMQSPVN